VDLGGGQLVGGVAVAAGHGHRLEQAVQHRFLGGLGGRGEIVVQRAPGDRRPGRGPAARRAQPGGQGQEDLAAGMLPGAAGPGQAQAGPAGQPLAAGAVQRPVGQHDHDARAGRPGRGLSRPGAGQQPARGQPGHGEPVPDAEVGHRDHADRDPAGQHSGRGADAALVTEAAHPGARADRALGGRAGPGGPAGRGQRIPHVLVADLHPAWFAEEAVVALGHDRDDDVVDTDPWLFRDQQFAGGVVDPAELHGRGEEHRGLGQPPLLRGQQPGAFAGPVEHRPAGRHRVAEQVTARVDHGDSGPGDAAAGRRRWLVPPHRGVAQAGPGHVEH